MSKFYILKLIYELHYFRYLLLEHIFKNPYDNNSAKKFLDFNNKRVLKKIKKDGVKKVAILLPHCIQKYDCNLKITNNIENCKMCGLCDIAEIVRLKDEFENINIKVATGGTLARLYLKEYKPNLVIAVACKRDLTSGIRDSFPILVYGVFNRIVKGPCKDTRVAVDEIRKVLREVGTT
ncbi:DUF116 domain-containing protein [Cetobacterium somerae]|uniref:DUF116 domain-containing protein n=1 Tax=Cetobacterium sp. NK01 TaxID=2993530 RepID=UPI002116BDDC|nr:DUF116 domain-containing protein [Cetobacterium sp. NK01]MCQ8212590.1 DUF116 domain-containing protein [Cetobacterium sp. NK01]